MPESTKSKIIKKPLKTHLIIETGFKFSIQEGFVLFIAELKSESCISDFCKSGIWTIFYNISGRIKNTELIQKGCDEA